MPPAARRPLVALVAGTLVGLLAACSCSGLTGESARRLVRMADEAVESGDTATAVSLLERIDLDASDSPEARIRLAELYRSRRTIPDRLRSQVVLERARQLHPGDADVLMALGRTYNAQSFYPDAERCFRQVLRIDPGRCEPRAAIGRLYFEKWRRVNAHHDDLQVARRYLKSALRCDSTAADVAVAYSYALYVLQRTDELARECEVFRARFPEVPEFHLLLGVLAFDDERYAEAQVHFERGLPLLPESSRVVFEQTKRMLSYGEEDRLRIVSVKEREGMERRRWLDLDPDATTGINERHLEHIYRVFLADVHFRVAHSARRGWDTERGELFVKFGWPTSIESSLDTPWNDGREERWVYVDGYDLRVFRFVDERLNGDLRIPYAEDVMLSYIRHSTQRYNFTPDAVPVPGDIDVVTFKDDDFSASLCIAVRIDADSLRRAADPAGFDRFRFRSALFDREWLAEKRTDETLWTGDVPVIFTNGRRRYDLVRALKVPFDYYHVACTFEDEGGQSATHLWADGDASRYAGDGVALSDIFFEGEPAFGANRVVRGEYSLVPNPGHVYELGQRLGLYFEVYGLGTRGGAARYDVTFAIYDAPEAPAPTWQRWGAAVARWMRIADDVAPAISQTFERRGPRHRASERIGIDIESLSAGRYQLVVTVRDRTTAEVAETAAVFVKRGGQEQARH